MNVNFKPVHPEKRYVIFEQNCAPYQAGNVGWFFKAEAAKLVIRKIAAYVKQNEEGDWVRTNEQGAVNDDHHVESNDENGPEPDSGNGEGEGAATKAEEPKQKARKKAAARKRVRAKLD